MPRGETSPKSTFTKDMDNSLANTLTLTREKRSNAGSRMKRLIDNQDEDAFYKSTYGGFNEDESDIDYAKSEHSSSSGEEDSFESDFLEEQSSSSNEEDEGKDEQSAGGKEKQQKKQKKRRDSDSDADGEAAARANERAERHRDKMRVQKYRDPLTKKQRVSGQSKPRKLRKLETASPTETLSESTGERGARGVGLRQSTVAKRLELDERREKLARTKSAREAAIREIAARKQVAQVRRLTQEELLEEAKQTELENLASLHQYERLEIEKAKSRQKPRDRTIASTPGIPRVNYHSMRMSELGTPSVSSDPPSAGTQTASGPFYERTFVSFSEESHYQSLFPSLNPNTRRKQLLQRYTHVRHLCPITGQPAKYLDPLTLTPYANVQAFKVIRQIYKQSLETGEKSLDLLRKYKRQAAIEKQQSSLSHSVHSQSQSQSQPSQPASISVSRSVAPATATIFATDASTTQSLTQPLPSASASASASLSHSLATRSSSPGANTVSRSGASALDSETVLKQLSSPAHSSSALESGHVVPTTSISSNLTLPNPDTLAARSLSPPL